ncbi:hypothetical protein CSE6_002_00320 [Comamonas sp. E6]|nr:hypothetical protein CSE6_002_00320 [Comamonas sp. E6]
MAWRWAGVVSLWTLVRIKGIAVSLDIKKPAVRTDAKRAEIIKADNALRARIRPQTDMT